MGDKVTPEEARQLVEQANAPLQNFPGCKVEMRMPDLEEIANKQEEEEGPEPEEPEEETVTIAKADFERLLVVNNELRNKWGAFAGGFFVAAGGIFGIIAALTFNAKFL